MGRLAIMNMKPDTLFGELQFESHAPSMRVGVIDSAKDIGLDWWSAAVW